MSTSHRSESTSTSWDELPTVIRTYLTAHLARDADVRGMFELTLAPTEAYARFALGRTLQRRSRHDEADVHFRVAAALDPHPELREPIDSPALQPPGSPASQCPSWARTTSPLPRYRHRAGRTG